MLDKEAHEQLPSVTSSTHMDLKASGIPLTYQINKGVGRFPEGLTQKRAHDPSVNEKVWDPMP